MKYKKLMALVLAGCLLLALSACKKEEETPVEEEVIDPNFPVQIELTDETITIHEAPQSVVSLSPAITTLFYELGEEEILVGVSSYAPAQAAGKTGCGTAQAVDLDAVKKISPDLLFTDTPLLTEQLTELYQMDVEVILIERPESQEEIVERGELILLALYGREDGAIKGEAFSESCEDAWAALEAVKEAVSAEERVNALLLADLYLAATGDCYEGQLLDVLAMNNLCAEGTDWQLPEAQTAEDGTISYVYGETVVEFNPDVIFYHSGMDVEAIKASELYANSNAVLNEALYPVDWTALQFQGQALYEQLGSMAEQVYPEVWEKIQADIAAQKAAEEAEKAAAEAAAAESAAQSETQTEK